MNKPFTPPEVMPPAFDRATARRVPARRHEPTARTVAYEQPADAEAVVHLFSVTGLWVATEPRAPGASPVSADAEIAASDLPST